MVGRLCGARPRSDLRRVRTRARSDHYTGLPGRTGPAPAARRAVEPHLFSSCQPVHPALSTCARFNRPVYHARVRARLGACVDRVGRGRFGAHSRSVNTARLPILVSRGLPLFIQAFGPCRRRPLLCRAPSSDLRLPRGPQFETRVVLLSCQYKLQPRRRPCCRTLLRRALPFASLVPLLASTDEAPRAPPRRARRARRAVRRRHG
jgi:hypothetical protein